MGSDNVVGIPVDLGARLDLGELEKRLRRNLDEKQPVLAVVGIIGSTEGERIIRRKAQLM